MGVVGSVWQHCENVRKWEMSLYNIDIDRMINYPVLLHNIVNSGQTLLLFPAFFL